MHALTITLLFTLAVVSHQKQEFSTIIEGYTQLMKPSREACIKESGSNNEIIDKLLNFGEFPEDKNLKCYSKCFLVNIEVLKPTGEVVEANIRKYVGVADEKAAEEIFNKCRVIRNEDQCEMSYRICECIYKGAKAVLV